MQRKVRGGIWRGWWVASLLAGAVAAEEGAPTVRCEICGQDHPAEQAVTLTEWDTGQARTYDCLRCGIEALAGQVPGSRLTTSSLASGVSLSLVRTQSGWMAEPLRAVATLPQGEAQPCAGFLAFANRREQKRYTARHRIQVPFRVVPLVELPDHVLAAPPQVPLADLRKRLVAPPRLSDLPPKHWAREAVQEIARAGLMEGYPDGTFRGDQPLTRYEIAMILQRLIHRLPPDMLRPSPAQEKAAARSAPAPRPQPAAPIPEPAAPATVNLVGTGGVLLSPTAPTLEERTGWLGYSRALESNLSVAAGGGGKHWEVGLAHTSGDLPNRLLLHGKYQVWQSESGDLQGAVGILDLGDDLGLTPYGVITQSMAGPEDRPLQLSVGLGAGDLAEGLFLGAQWGLTEKLNLLAETVRFGDERDLNLGVDYTLTPDWQVKLGVVGGEEAVSLATHREF